MANSSDRDSLSLSIHSAGAGCLGSRPPNHNSIRSPLCTSPNSKSALLSSKPSESEKRTYSATTGDYTDDETFVALLLGGGEALGGAAFEDRAGEEEDEPLEDGLEEGGGRGDDETSSLFDVSECHVSVKAS